MLYINREALNARLGIVTETPKVVLKYSNALSNGNMLSIVKDANGKVLFSATLTPKGDKMVVTDYRKNTVKEETISLSTSLNEVATDMRNAGYLAENETLEWDKVRFVRN